MNDLQGVLFGVICRKAVTGCSVLILNVAQTLKNVCVFLIVRTTTHHSLVFSRSSCNNSNSTVLRSNAVNKESTENARYFNIFSLSFTNSIWYHSKRNTSIGVFLMRYLSVPLNPLFEKSERGFALSLSFTVVFHRKSVVPSSRQTIRSLFLQ